MHISRVSKFFFQKFIGFYFVNAQQVHDLENAVRNTTTARNGYFDIGQFQPEISMYQFLETINATYPLQCKATCTLAISHHAVMCTYDAGKETKANDTCAVIMLQAFVIN